MTRILVTGARGFIGRALAARLSARGHEVIGSERTAASVALPGVDRMLAGDLLDPRDAERVVTTAAPVVVIHLAARAVGMTGGARPGDDDARMTANVLDAIARTPATRHLIFASSAAVYAPRVSGPIVENGEVRPTSDYGKVKAAGEAQVRAFAGHERAATILRFGNVIGAGERRPSVVSAICHQIVRAERGGDATIRHGRLDEARDFVDVADVARAIAACCELDATGAQTFNVGTGSAVAISAVVAMLVALSRTPVRLELDPSLVRAGPATSVALDSSALNARVGWRPEVPLATSLAATLDSWRAAPDR
jgi:nucleoside-diphosphate-sugar epimerase